MPEMITVARDELVRCEERARRLAKEKSYLQLVNNLMTQLSEVTGIESVIERMLTLLLDNLGGSKVSLYYCIGTVIYYADVYGEKISLEAIDDEIVKRTFDSREFIEIVHDFEQTKMLTPEFTKASTWAAPLMVGDELMGVLKLDDMLMAAAEIRKQFEPFLNYFALVLRNEISGYANLKKAYDDLTETNAKLSTEIRQREMAESSLRMTQFAVDHASDCLFWITPEAGFANVNDSTCCRLGYSREELLNLTVFDVDPEFPREAWESHWQEIKERKAFTIKTKHRTKDGEIFPVEVTVNHVQYEGAEYNFAFARDISAREREEAFQKALSRILLFADSHSLDEVLEESLNELEKLTGSEIGFYHFVGQDQTTLELQNWSARTKKELCKAEGKGLHYELVKAGVWADCVRQRQPVIHNDYASLSDKKGLPPGHAIVIRELVVPVIRGDKIKAILGIGNKPSLYDEQDVRIASLFAELAWDITERKRTDEALAREREFIRALLESMEDGVVACDADGVLALFNRTARQWHGIDLLRLPPEEWAKHYDLYCADGITPLPEEEVPLVRAFKGEKVIGAEMAILAKGQAPRFILANGSLIRDAEGKVLGAVVVMRDITEIRRIEEELRQANETLEQAVAKRTAELEETLRCLELELEERRRVEEKLQVTQFAVDSSADVIFWIRRDGSFAYWNRAACEQFGYSSHDFLSLKTSDLNPEHHGEAWLTHWAELNRVRFLRFETVVVKKDGARIPVEITANLVAFNDQEYNCAFVRDISDRKRAEADLIDSNERFRAFMDYAPFYAYVKDAELNHVFANKRTMELISGPKPEPIRTTHFFAGDILQKIEAADRRILEGVSEVEELEYQTPMADKEVWLKDIKFPIVFSDGTRMLGGVAVDISERMKAEEEIMRSFKEWSAAMDASEDVIYLLDLDRRLVRANKAFFAYTGSTPETAIGKPIVELVHPEGETIPCPVCRAQEEKRDLVFTMESDHPHNPAGRPIEVMLKVVRDDDGRAMSLLLTLHDLSHERKIQEELAEYREHLEALVKSRTAEIEKKKAELERMNKMFVGRELRMIELKKRIKTLEEHSGAMG